MPTALEQLGMIDPDLPHRIIEVARAENVHPEQYAALVMTESRGNPRARSPVGAMGYAQLMPDTAKELGVDPNDPMQNLRGGARYLRQLQQQFGGDPAKAFTAYHSGPGNVQRGSLGPQGRAYWPTVQGFMADEAEGLPPGFADPGPLGFSPGQPPATPAAPQAPPAGLPAPQSGPSWAERQRDIQARIELTTGMRPRPEDLGPAPPGSPFRDAPVPAQTPPALAQAQQFPGMQQAAPGVWEERSSRTVTPQELPALMAEMDRQWAQPGPADAFMAFPSSGAYMGDVRLAERAGMATGPEPPVAQEPQPWWLRWDDKPKAPALPGLVPGTDQFEAANEMGPPTPSAARYMQDPSGYGYDHPLASEPERGGGGFAEPPPWMFAPPAQQQGIETPDYGPMGPPVPEGYGPSLPGEMGPPSPFPPSRRRPDPTAVALKYHAASPDGAGLFSDVQRQLEQRKLEQTLNQQPQQPGRGEQLLSGLGRAFAAGGHAAGVEPLSRAYETMTEEQKRRDAEARYQEGLRGVRQSSIADMLKTDAQMRQAQRGQIQLLDGTMVPAGEADDFTRAQWNAGQGARYESEQDIAEVERQRDQANKERAFGIQEQAQKRLGEDSLKRREMTDARLLKLQNDMRQSGMDEKSVNDILMRAISLMNATDGVSLDEAIAEIMRQRGALGAAGSPPHPAAPSAAQAFPEAGSASDRAALLEYLRKRG